jgi:hypothetical protein
MGSSFGIKIISLPENHILREITFNNRKFIEYIYYITKINKFYIENVKKNTLMNEFTIMNIITGKEYNLMIERVEIGYFLEGMKYKSEELPKLEKFVVITGVFDDSLAKRVGLKVGTVILGNENMYFCSLYDIEKQIGAKSAEFVFYDIEGDSVFGVDFESNRDEQGELRLGFECEEIKREDLAKRIEQKCDMVKVQNLGLFELDGVSNGKYELKDVQDATVDEAKLVAEVLVLPDIAIVEEKSEVQVIDNPFNNNGKETIENIIAKNPFDDEAEIETQLLNTQISSPKDEELHKDKYFATANQCVEQVTNSNSSESSGSSDTGPEYLITGYFLAPDLEGSAYTTSHTLLKISDLDKNTINVN